MKNVINIIGVLGCAIGVFWTFDDSFYISGMFLAAALIFAVNLSKD